MLDNNGILGCNQSVCVDHLTAEDRKNLAGFMLSALELKEELKSKTRTATVTKTGKPRKPRDGKSTPNTYIDLFRRVGSYDVMPSIVEDLFIGAVRQNTTGNIHNQYVIFGLMKSLHEITTENVYVRVNSRRSKSDRIDQRYAQSLANACRNVIKVFDHHEKLITEQMLRLEQMMISEVINDDFDIEQDAADYLSHIQPEQSEHQRMQLLRDAGLTPEQIASYMTGQRVSFDSRNLVCSAGIRIIVKGQSQIITNYYKRSDLESGLLEWLPELSCYVNTETGEILEWH